MTATPAWPEGVTTRCYHLHGESFFAADMGDGRRAFHGRGPDEQAAQQAAWLGYRASRQPGHEHDFDPGEKRSGWGQCTSCGMSDDEAFEKRRTVDYGRYAIAAYWPAEWHVSGGSRGLVVSRDGSGVRRTAFFEVYPRDPDTFVRGEGETIEQAEAAAWEQVQRHLACTGHEFETRGYTNGAGFCRHCGMFASGVFDVAVVGNPCTVCGERTNWSQVAGAWYCRQHEPSRGDRRAMRAAARDARGTSGDSFLDEMLDDFDD